MCKLNPVVRQFLVVACCSVLVFSFGLSTGWATINFVELNSENSTYPIGPLDDSKLQLVTSLSSLGGFLGNYVILPLTPIVGIKRTIHLLCVPAVISAVLTIYAKNIYILYIARILTGIVGGGLAVGLPSLINDISHDNVRGALNSLFDPFNNLATIISGVLGNYLSIIDQVKIQLIPPIIFLVLLFFIPESPEHWISKNKKKKAIKSHRFYKGSTIELNESNKYDFVAVPQSEKHEQIENGKENTDDESSSPLTLADFCTPHAKRAFFISFVSLILCFISGPLSIIAYSTYIFKETGSEGSSLSEKNATIVSSIITLVANLVFLCIVERFNRKTLYVCSSFLSMVALFVFAAYMCLWQNQPGFEWMPPFCVASIIYFSFMGLLPIPYIITLEIFPQKIRSTCLALAISAFWAIQFGVGSKFISFAKYVELYNCMIIFGVICLLNALFGIFFVPETRGKSYEEITEIMSK